MKLLAILGLSRASQPQFAQSQLMPPEPASGSQGANAARFNTRCELLRVVLRDTLNRQGIPAAWLGAEIRVSTSRSGLQGIHWRLLVRHWDPRLLMHAVALQQKLYSRVMTFDPFAANWLTGISWQFALPDESVCPAMPHPGTWTAQPSQATMRTAKASTAETSVDVIAGPVRIPDSNRSSEADVRANLDRLMAVCEKDYKRNSSADGAGPNSQFVRTVPMRLE
jgi:hypothetical protein